MTRSRELVKRPLRKKIGGWVGKRRRNRKADPWKDRDLVQKRETRGDRGKTGRGTLRSWL